MTTRVVVLGAGFGGLELATTVTAELGDDVERTLIDRIRRWFGREGDNSGASADG